MSFWNDLSFGSKIMIVLSVFFVGWLVSSYIIIRYNYKALFDWWVNNDGSKYDNLFDLFAVCTANYSTPLYYISKFFTNPLNQLNLDQTRFVIGQLLPYNRIDKDGRQNGIITPKSLCETVLLSSQDNDVLFNNWFNNFGTRGGKAINEKIFLAYNPNTPVKNNLGRDTYSYSLIPNTGDNANYYGLYPSPLDRPSWCGLILEWLGPDDWIMEMGTDDILHPVRKDSSPKATLDKWFQNNGDGNDIGRGDNFLARMGITPNCPLVLFFCNNISIVQGQEVDTQAFVNLLAPAGSLSGGWIGFLNGDSKLSYDKYIWLLQSVVDDPRPQTPTPPQCKQPDAGAGWIAGLGSGLPLAAMAAPMFVEAGAAAEIATGGLITPFLIIAGAIGLGVLNGLQAGKGTCPDS